MAGPSAPPRPATQNPGDTLLYPPSPALSLSLSPPPTLPSRHRQTGEASGMLSRGYSPQKQTIVVVWEWISMRWECISVLWE